MWAIIIRTFFFLKVENNLSGRKHIIWKKLFEGYLAEIFYFLKLWAARNTEREMDR